MKQIDGSPSVNRKTFDTISLWHNAYQKGYLFLYRLFIYLDSMLIVYNNRLNSTVRIVLFLIFTIERLLLFA